MPTIPVQVKSNYRVTLLTGEGNSYPLQYSGLENPIGCTVHGVAKSDKTERLSLHYLLISSAYYHGHTGLNVLKHTKFLASTALVLSGMLFFLKAAISSFQISNVPPEAFHTTPESDEGTAHLQSLLHPLLALSTINHVLLEKQSTPLCLSLFICKINRTPHRIQWKQWKRVRLYFGGLQNHCRWWLQPLN